MEILKQIEELQNFVIESEKKLNDIEYSLSRNDILYIFKNERLIIKTQLTNILQNNKAEAKNDSTCDICGTDACH